MKHEIRHVFFEQLRDLERQVLEAFDLVIEQLGRAMEAVAHGDAALAESVVAADHPIDCRFLEVHHGAITLLASQAPVAGDLRLVPSNPVFLLETRKPSSDT